MTIDGNAQKSEKTDIIMESSHNGIGAVLKTVVLKSIVSSILTLSASCLRISTDLRVAHDTSKRMTKI